LLDDRPSHRRQCRSAWTLSRVGVPMSDDDHVRLLHGPYNALPLRRGDRASCLYRDCLVVITRWSDAPIPWPRCRALAGGRGGSGLLVDEELARAVRCESVLAIRHWWGASANAVWRWRRALGVRGLNEGSARLRQQLNREIGESLRGRKLPAEQVERRRRAWKLGGRPVPLRPGGNRPWTAKELALLGSAPDAEVATRIRRTVNAVRVMRKRLGRPTALDRRRREQQSKG
jgi:hypothetical protein